MFPRSLIFFLMILGVDMVSKSVREKKKVQKARAKKIDQMKKMVYTEKAPKVTTEPRYKRPETENAVEDSKSNKSVESKGKDRDKKKREKSKEQFKEDVLRGVIFSEILSKPKALNKKRKSV